MGKRWDSVPVPSVQLNDLDSGTLNRFRERAARSKRLGVEILEEDDGVLIEKLRLMDGEYLKRAAILLFHPDPEQYITGASLRIGYFRSDSDLRYHDDIQGNLFTQVERAMDLLLTKYLQASISYEGVQRVESYPIPEDALREILLNAVAHKDYGSGVPIQISVYDDRILFWNNGQLPEEWTIENLTSKHSSQPFNPDIANAFFRAGMVETWGRGIEKVVQSCQASGIQPPELRYEAPGLWVEFRYRTVDPSIGKTTTQKTTQETTQKTTQEIPQKILAILREKPRASRRQIASILTEISEDGVKYHLAKMKANEQIRHVGPSKGGRWEVLDKSGEKE